MSTIPKKGQLTLEYIARMLIVLVVVAVVIGIITTFNEDAKRMLQNIIGADDKKEEYKSELIEKDYSSSDVANLIETCRVETLGTGEDRICFVLKGTYKDSNENAKYDIISKLDEPAKSHVILDDADFSKNIVIIHYEIASNMIVLKS